MVARKDCIQRELVLVSAQVLQKVKVAMRTRGIEIPSGRVVALMGVNGTGKSTLSDRLAVKLPKTGVIHASQELRELFGGISREQQNKMAIEDRLGEIATHLTSVFDRGLNDNDRVLFDTQLLVANPGEERKYESAWSDRYSPYLASAAMLLATPDTISRWRREDGIRTGRMRDLSQANIAQDQQANLDYFNELVKNGALPATSEAFHNEDGKVAQIEQDLADHIMATT
jgi:nicotinamide riboside kinase